MIDFSLIEYLGAVSQTRGRPPVMEMKQWTVEEEDLFVIE